jgi:hypothetical protein
MLDRHDEVEVLDLRVVDDASTVDRRIRHVLRVETHDPLRQRTADCIEHGAELDVVIDAGLLRRKPRSSRTCVLRSPR